ncbi:MAG TPA: hypothetical protein VF796_13250 [Humisphaera sp.]
MTTPILIIPSACGLYRAEIVRRRDGAFQVDVSRWTEEWVPEYGKVDEFWAPVRDGLTLTDTLERARERAIEKLADQGARVATP